MTFAVECDTFYTCGPNPWSVRPLANLPPPDPTTLVLPPPVVRIFTCDPDSGRYRDGVTFYTDKDRHILLYHGGPPRDETLSARRQYLEHVSGGFVSDTIDRWIDAGLIHNVTEVCNDESLRP